MTRKVMGSVAVQATTTKAIDLVMGWPNLKLLPPEALRVAANHVCTDTSIWTPALCYGPDEGYLPLRQSIASWLTDFYRPARPVAYEEICITGGASQNLGCILQTFSDPFYTRNVWVVSPTYFHACKIFDDSGFGGRLRAVPEDEEGIDIEYLSREIQTSEDQAQKEGNDQPKFKLPRTWRKIYKHLIYAVPTFSNPSGRLMSLSRRRALVRLARKYDALIITDDVYDMLQWPAHDNDTGNDKHPDEFPSLQYPCLPRIVDIDASLDGGPIDEFGNAISNGTFSKIVAPGCRTGWAQGTAKLALGLSKTGTSQSGGAPSQFTSTLIDQMLRTSVLQRHITHTLQPSYSRRYHSMLHAIEKYLLPLGCTLVSKPAITPVPSLTSTSTTEQTELNFEASAEEQKIGGGYFHYITLPSDLTTKYARHQEHLHKVPTHDQGQSQDQSRDPTQNGDIKNDPFPTIGEHIAAKALDREQLRIMPGSLSRVEGDKSETAHERYAADIRLSFAWEDEEYIAEGVERLSRVIEQEMKVFA